MKKAKYSIEESFENICFIWLTFSMPRDNNFHLQGSKIEVKHRIVQAAKYNSETNFSLDQRYTNSVKS